MSPQPATRAGEQSVVSSARQNASSNSASRRKRCDYSTSDNRRCTMFAHRSHGSLCLHHARKERLLLDTNRVARQLQSIDGEFRTHTDVNRALGKLWDMLAQDRIPRKRAATMAYVASLVLPNLSSVRHEASLASSERDWISLLRRALQQHNAAALGSPQPPSQPAATRPTPAPLPQSNPSPALANQRHATQTTQPSQSTQSIQSNQPPQVK